MHNVNSGEFCVFIRIDKFGSRSRQLQLSRVIRQTVLNTSDKTQGHCRRHLRKLTTSLLPPSSHKYPVLNIWPIAVQVAGTWRRSLDFASLIA